jgi:uncharacterized protein (TIGR03083 family)
MGTSALDGLRADRQALVEICGRIENGGFESESGCPGWSVKDVVAHMGALFWMVVDLSVLPDVAGLGTEQAQDVLVDQRRPWSARRVVEDYEVVSTRALEVLAGFEGQDLELELGDLGTYPARLLANAYAFDHYTHIRADLFPPRGPLSGSPPRSDELRLGPALDWIESAVAQQNREVTDALTGAVEVKLTGVCSRSFSVGRGEPTAWITCDAANFVLAVTGRADWERAGVVASGDEEQLALARELHVF